ncbi:hypothetical protein [Formosa sp. PL04]|uniref:hypothetical protein n=1 Tax=Formosa sp. PL04 TaxID=3081755 RepID=UPI002981A3ED|nr:hypothetical protein [Formosa sp. PL04]MDW5290594.1 hypothetical protein [Formosa sp. PL04]
MSKKIETIVQLFPDFEEQIVFLFRTDENFRELCSDYILCLSMVLKRQEDITKHKEEIAEFEELQQNLEAEILNEINAL